jgi:hypothetical protein
MKQYIGCDRHARCSIFVSIDQTGKVPAPVRVEHDELEMRCLSGQFASGLAASLTSK